MNNVEINNQVSTLYQVYARCFTHLTLTPHNHLIIIVSAFKDEKLSARIIKGPDY